MASATVFFRWSTAAVHARESYAGRKYDASATDRSMAMTSAWSASSAALRSSAGLASGVPTADRCEFTSPSTRAFRSSKPARNDRMFSLGSAAASNSALRASASALRASSMAARRSCGGAGLRGERSVKGCLNGTIWISITGDRRLGSEVRKAMIRLDGAHVSPSSERAWPPSWPGRPHRWAPTPPRPWL